MGSGNQTIATEEQRIGALRIQSSAYGLALPIVWGRTRINGNLIYYGDFTAIAHTTEQAMGGKGGGEVTQKNTTYTYTTAAAFGIAEGPIDGIGDVWSGKEKKSAAELGLSLFLGTYPQAPWGYLTTNHPSQARAYQGLAYAAGVMNLGSSANLPNLGFEVLGRFAFGGGIPDANPRNIVEDALSNPNYGAGFAGARLGDLTLFSDYCVAHGLFLSPAFTEQRAAQEHLGDLLKAVNSAPVWSGGQLKIIPYGDSAATGNGATYTPALDPIYDLTDDDFLGGSADDPVICGRKTTADAYNQVQVEYLDRANGYNPAIVEVKDQANIETYGLRPMEPVRVHAVCTPAIAQTVASLILQRALYIRNEYEFRLGWRYCLLEPMDIVTITDQRLGLDRALVRILEVEEDEDGELSVRAEEFPFGVATAPLIPTQVWGGYTVDLNVAPGNANTPVVFEPPVALAGGAELWLATSGGLNWGGAEVWVSLDNASYKQVGVIHGPARHGTLSAPLVIGSDPDLVNLLSVDLGVCRGSLIGGTAEDRDVFNTLCYVDGELVSYQAAALTGVHRYNLSSLRRGVHGTAIAAHATGSKFARLDAAIFRYAYDPALIGKTLYLKLRSFNIYGGAAQELASVTPSTYVIEGAPMGAVSGLALEQPFVGRSCRIQWTAYPGVASYTYTVAVYAGAALKRTVTGLADPRYEYSFEDAIADGGPFRALEFRVKAVSVNGESSQPAVLAAANPQIGAPAGILTSPAGASISISATRPAASDYAGTRIWMSTSGGFDPAVTTPVYDGPNNFYTAIALTGGQTYYFRLAHYDVFGTDGLTTSGEIAVIALHEGGVRKVTSLPANPAAVNGETAVFLDVAEATNQRGLWGWDGTAWQYTRSGASLVANSVTADRLSVANLGAISANLGTVTAGNFTLDAAGFVRGGMTDFSNGTGFWFGYKTGAYKLSLGQSGGSQIVWDGSALNIYGSLGQLLLSSGGVQWGGVTGSGKPADNATVGANSSNLAIGVGGNLIANSDFEATVDPWIVNWVQSGGSNYTFVRDLAGTDWTPAGGHQMGVRRWGDTLTGVIDLRAIQKIPVVPGKRYELSAYVASHRCDAYPEVGWYKLVGGVETYVTETAFSGARLAGGQSLSNWTRKGGFVTAPADAQYVYIWMRVNPVDGGQTDGYAWGTRFFFAEALAGQTELSPWSKGGAIGALSNVSQITAANASTYIAAAAIGSAQIGDASITNAKIGDASITNAKIGAAAISSVNIGDAEVGTLKLAGNAVTVPSSAYTEGALNWAGTGTLTVQTLVITASGATVWLAVTCGINATNPTSSPTLTMVVKRDGVAIWSRTQPAALTHRSGPGPTDYYGFRGILTATFSDTPSAGPHTYTVEVYSSASSCTADNRSILALEVKR